MNHPIWYTVLMALSSNLNSVCIFILFIALGNDVTRIEELPIDLQTNLIFRKVLLSPSNDTMKIHVVFRLTAPFTVIKDFVEFKLLGNNF